MSTVANRIRASGSRRFERRRQHRRGSTSGSVSHTTVTAVDQILRSRRLDLAVALLFGWTGAVSNRHDRESSTATRASVGRNAMGRGSCDAVDGKVAVVTGGANGIGLAMGRHFAGHGMSVMLADIQRGPLDAAVAPLRGRRARRRRLRHRRDEARVGRTPCRRDDAHVRRACTWCATTRASVRAGRRCCGSTRRTTGVGASTSTCRRRVGDQGVRAAHDRRAARRVTSSTRRRATVASRRWATRRSTRRRRAR